MADLSTKLCGIRLQNPVIAASGTFGFGREYAQLYDLSRLGGISVKGLTLQPRQGNGAHRMAETASGMLNAVGLQNPGVDAFIAEELPFLLAQGRTAVIANIAGSTVDDYCRMAEKLAPTGVHIIEMNISCPNVKEGGVAFGVKPEMVYAVTRAVKKYARQPLMVKLSPNVADIADNARAAEDGGADCLSLINTLTGIAVDARHKRMVLANNVGGLSGPAIKPVALRMVWQASHAVSIPVVGMGGIMTGEDAAEFLLCGAQAVMVGTASFADPFACPRIVDELDAFLQAQKVRRVSELVGALIEN